MPDATDSWLVIRTESVPDRWRHRAVYVALVPLLPGEVTRLSEDGNALPELGGTDETIAHLVARGLTCAAMAQKLNISTRTVDRRLACLRERFGAGSTAELAVELAKRGF